MLQISRNIREAFFINDNIKVEIISISGRQVKIGITAPPEIAIVRDDAINKKPKKSILNIYEDNNKNRKKYLQT